MLPTADAYLNQVKQNKTRDELEAVIDKMDDWPIYEFEKEDMVAGYEKG